MSFADKRTWQIAAGDANRSYADLCLKWSVVLNGPGRFGPWPDCKKSFAGEVSSRKTTDLTRFFDVMRDGDLVVLRLGTTDVYGVGIVVGDQPGWSDAFGDVDGWDLQFLRRVRWFWRYDQEGPDGKPKRFPTYTLKLGDTIQEMTSTVVRDWIAALYQEAPRLVEGDLIQLPDDATVLPHGLEEINEYLFDRGMAAGSIDALTDQMNDLVRIAKWYQRSGLTPLEHETVAYLVVPLLRALGWTPQKMAIEWNYVDVALFDVLPREPGNLVVSVEAKRLDQSCLTAAGQAADYATVKGRESCQRLIVTDGIRYGVYVRDPEHHAFLQYPSAYLSLTQMRPAYPIYGSGGARDALLLMAPDWRKPIGPDEGPSRIEKAYPG